MIKNRATSEKKSSLCPNFEFLTERFSYRKTKLDTSIMSDSDSDDSRSPKRRRYDEAEEGEEEDVADEQEPEGRDLDDSDDDDYRSKKKKGRAANARDFIIDEAEVRLC